MQQSDRQSVYGKLLGMTSNTSDYFETGEILWSC